MKTLLMAVGILALLPFAAPAILASMLIVGLLIHWLAPVLWVAAVVFIVVKLWGRVWKQEPSPSSSLSPLPSSTPRFFSSDGS